MHHFQLIEVFEVSGRLWLYSGLYCIQCGAAVSELHWLLFHVRKLAPRDSPFHRGKCCSLVWGQGLSVGEATSSCNLRRTCLSGLTNYWRFHSQLSKEASMAVPRCCWEESLTHGRIEIWVGAVRTLVSIGPSRQLIFGALQACIKQ